MQTHDVRILLSRVAAQSDAQDDRVLGNLADAGLPESGVAYAQLRGGAQALLTGESHRACAGPQGTAPMTDWGSWIEGIPFAQSFLFNRGMIVDILPCATEKEFRANYHCTPFQFCEILNAVTRSGNGRSVYFNFRNYNPAQPESADIYADSAGLDHVFRWFRDHDLKGCYLNATRSRALLGLFDRGGRTNDIEARLGGADREKALATALITQLSDALKPERHGKIMADHSAALVRGPAGNLQVPVPIQVFKRIAYHLSFSEICPDIPLDPEIGALRDDIEKDKKIGFERLMAVTALATQLHHLYTAPLTGAYGGTYNLTGSEVDHRRVGPIGLDQREQHAPFIEFLYATVAGRLQINDSTLEILRDATGPITLMQKGGVPDEAELRTFLNMLGPCEEFLRSRDALKQALDRRIARRRPDSMDENEKYIDEAQRAFDRHNSIIRSILEKIMIGFAVQGGGVAAAFGVTVCDLTLLASVIGKCAENTSEVLGKNVYDRLVLRGRDSRQIVDILHKAR